MGKLGCCSLVTSAPVKAAVIISSDTPSPPSLPIFRYYTDSLCLGNQNRFRQNVHGGRGQVGILGRSDLFVGRKLHFPRSVAYFGDATHYLNEIPRENGCFKHDVVVSEKESLVPVMAN